MEEMNVYILDILVMIKGIIIFIIFIFENEIEYVNFYFI